MEIRYDVDVKRATLKWAPKTRDEKEKSGSSIQISPNPPAARHSGSPPIGMPRPLPPRDTTGCPPSPVVQMTPKRICQALGARLGDTFLGMRRSKLIPDSEVVAPSGPSHISAIAARGLGLRVGGEAGKMDDKRRDTLRKEGSVIYTWRGEREGGKQQFCIGWHTFST